MVGLVSAGSDSGSPRQPRWVRCRVYPFTSSFDESHSEAPPLRFPRLQHRMEFLSRQKYVIHL